MAGNGRRSHAESAADSSFDHLFSDFFDMPPVMSQQQGPSAKRARLSASGRGASGGAANSARRDSGPRSKPAPLKFEFKTPQSQAGQHGSNVHTASAKGEGQSAGSSSKPQNQNMNPNSGMKLLTQDDDDIDWGDDDDFNKILCQMDKSNPREEVSNKPQLDDDDLAMMTMVLDDGDFDLSNLEPPALNTARQRLNQSVAVLPPETIHSSFYEPGPDPAQIIGKLKEENKTLRMEHQQYKEERNRLQMQLKDSQKTKERVQAAQRNLQSMLKKEADLRKGKERELHNARTEIQKLLVRLQNTDINQERPKHDAFQRKVEFSQPTVKAEDRTPPEKAEVKETQKAKEEQEEDKSESSKVEDDRLSGTIRLSTPVNQLLVENFASVTRADPAPLAGLLLKAKAGQQRQADWLQLYSGALQGIAAISEEYVPGLRVLITAGSSGSIGLADYEEKSETDSIDSENKLSPLYKSTRPSSQKKSAKRVKPTRTKGLTKDHLASIHRYLETIEEVVCLSEASDLLSTDLDRVSVMSIQLLDAATALSDLRPLAHMFRVVSLVWVQEPPQLTDAKLFLSRASRLVNNELELRKSKLSINSSELLPKELTGCDLNVTWRCQLLWVALVLAKNKDYQQLVCKRRPFARSDRGESVEGSLCFVGAVLTELVDLCSQLKIIEDTQYLLPSRDSDIYPSSSSSTATKSKKTLPDKLIVANNIKSLMLTTAHMNRFVMTSLNAGTSWMQLKCVPCGLLAVRFLINLLHSLVVVHDMAEPMTKGNKSKNIKNLLEMLRRLTLSTVASMAHIKRELERAGTAHVKKEVEQLAHIKRMASSSSAKRGQTSDFNSWSKILEGLHATHRQKYFWSLERLNAIGRLLAEPKLKILNKHLQQLDTLH